MKTFLSCSLCTQSNHCYLNRIGINKNQMLLSRIKLRRKLHVSYSSQVNRFRSPSCPFWSEAVGILPSFSVSGTNFVRWKTFVLYIWPFRSRQTETAWKSWHQTRACKVAATVLNNRATTIPSWLYSNIDCWILSNYDENRILTRTLRIYSHWSVDIHARTYRETFLGSWIWEIWQYKLNNNAVHCCCCWNK